MRDQILWERIKSFQLDDAKAQFTFSQRLARDNKWSLSFAKRVIQEYKRFLYLGCVGNTEITPSDEVDQAWHQHLTFTKSYWVELCQNTLEREFHHNPTKGGTKEQKRFSEAYDHFFKLYQEEFGTKPPVDIWPDNESRFKNINFKRINLADYWLIRKPNYVALFLFPASVFITILFVKSEEPVPWVAIIVGIVLLMVVVRTIKSGRGGKKRRGRGSGSDGWWGGFWGCSSDSNDGSGCSSGCGGGSGCGGCGN